MIDTATTYNPRVVFAVVALQHTHSHYLTALSSHW